MKNQAIQKIFISLLIVQMNFSVAVAENRNDVTGLWLFNQQLSDNFQEKIKEMIKMERRSKRKPDGSSGATQGKSGRGNGNKYSSNRGQQPSMSGGNYWASFQKKLRHLTLFSQKMQIVQNGSEIIINLTENKQRTINTKGKGVTIFSDDSLSSIVWPYIAEWNLENQLEVETSISGGIKIEEYFKRSSDGNQLHTLIRIKSPVSEKFIEINRFYDLIQKN